MLYIDLRPGRAVRIGNASVIYTGASGRGISEYNLDRGRVEWVRFVTPTRRRWTYNYYITLCTWSSISWWQDAVEKASTQQSGPSGPRLSSYSWRKDAGMRNMSQSGWGPRKSVSFGDQTSWWQDAVEKASTQQSGPSGPRLSSPGERERNAFMAIGVGVNMLQFCSVSNSLSHTTLSIKWEVYFSRELCRSSLLCRRYDSACRCIWVCNTNRDVHLVMSVIYKVTYDKRKSNSDSLISMPVLVWLILKMKYLVESPFTKFLL